MLLYFLPNLAAVRAADLDAAGLGGVFRGCPFTGRGTTAGPGGMPGQVVVAEPENPLARKPAIGYFPDKQTWQQAPARQSLGDGGWWIGWETASPPTPADLQRREAVGGYAVRLEDGNDWLVPVARRFPSGTMLPERLALGPAGEWVSAVIPRFAKFAEQAERVWVEFQRQAGVPEAATAEPLSVADEIDIAVEALGINYRIGRVEASVLGLLTTTNKTAILESLIDWPTLIAVGEQLKKKEYAGTPDGSNS